MELFRLFGTIAVNNALANKGIDETTEKAEKAEGKIGKAFKGIGKAALKIGVATTAAAATATVALTKSAVDSYAQYEQLVGGVDTLFKKSSGKVQQYAANAYKTAGMSANEYMETVTSFSASLLQSLGGNTKKAAESANLAITDMADNANKMGTSMEMIQNAYQGFAKQNYMMLDNLKLGYGGTKQEMERLLEDASKLSGVKYDISSFDDMVQAIHVVQTELGITGTTAKEAATTIEGSVASMKSAFENLLVGIADGNQDTSKLFQNLYDAGMTVAKNLVPRIKITIEGLWGLVKQIAPQIAATLPKALKGASENLTKVGTEWMEKLGEGIQKNLPSIIRKGLDFLTGFTASLRENAGKMMDSGMELILKIGQGIANSLPDLIAKVPIIVSNIANVINDNAPKLLVTAGKLILTLAKGLIQAIPTLVKSLPQIIKAIVDVFQAFQWATLGKNIITKLKDGIVAMKSKVSSAAKGIFDAVVNKIKQLPQSLYNLARQAINRMVTIIKHTASLKDAANAIVTDIAVVIGKLPSRMLSIGRNLVQGLWNGIGSAKDWIISKVRGFGDSILTSLKDFFGIHSPSKVMEEKIGKNLALGVAEGISKNKKYADKSASELGKIIVESAEKKLDRYKTYNKMSLADEVAYWDNIRKTVKKGTSARLEADKKYFEAKKSLNEKLKSDEQQKLTDAEKILDRRKTYNKVSLADEVDYWNKVRKQFKKGTEERLQADKSYFEAKKSLNEQLKALEDDYKAKVEEATKKITDRTKEILNAFNLFDEFKQTVDEENPLTGDTLLNNLSSQVNALDEWTEEMASLKGKLSNSELYAAIQDMGVSSLQQVKAINSMTEAQLNQYVELYNKRAKMAEEQATAELGAEVNETKLKAYKDYQDAVAAVGKTVKKTMTDSEKVTSTKFSNMASAVAKSTKAISDAVSTKFSAVQSKVKSSMSSAASAVTSSVNSMIADLARLAAEQTAQAATPATSTKTTTTKKTTVKKNASGGILTKPTIFGFTPSTGQWQLGGEAGDEAIAPIDTLKQYVAEAVASQNGEMVAVLMEILKAIKGQNLSVTLDGKEIANNVNKRLGVIY